MLALISCNMCVHTQSMCCCCRWKEAADAGKAPPVVLSGCHIKALDYVDLALLQQYAVKEDEEDEQQQKGEL